MRSEREGLNEPIPIGFHSMQKLTQGSFVVRAAGTRLT
jgi:hypothetical protein